MHLCTDLSLKKELIDICKQAGFPIEAMKNLKLYHYGQSEFILKQGQTIKNIYLLVKGSCRVFKYLENGIEAIIHINHGFQVYGEVELFQPQTTNTNIQALTDCFCVLIPYSEDLKNNIAVNHFCIKQLSNKLNTYDQNHLMNSHYSVETRLSTYILCSQKNDFFTSNYTHLASYLGCSYRHLVRILNHLCEKDILLKRNGFYQIIDHKKLKTLASDFYQM